MPPRVSLGVGMHAFLVFRHTLELWCLLWLISAPLEAKSVILQVLIKSEAEAQKPRFMVLSSIF